MYRIFIVADANFVFSSQRCLLITVCCSRGSAVTLLARLGIMQSAESLYNIYIYIYAIGLMDLLVVSFVTESYYFFRLAEVSFRLPRQHLDYAIVSVCLSVCLSLCLFVVIVVGMIVLKFELYELYFWLELYELITEIQ